MRLLKTITFIAFFYLFATQIGLAQDTESPDDLILIRQTLEDYIEGSTDGQPERLKKAFHPNLNLYSIKNGKLQVWPGKDYIRSTKEGQPTGEEGSILSIDFENDTAVAKVKIAPPSGKPFIDYFMLLKIKGKWTIVHKMYTRRTTKAATEGEWLTNEAKHNESKPNQKEGSESRSLPNATKPKSNPKVSATVASEIDRLFSEYDQLDSPGCALTLIRNGETVFQKGYGAANLEHRVPVDAQTTVFNIGSVSKQFTAFAVLLLADDGKLSLDDDIKKHIPELSKIDCPISLRQLAHHTSGIRSELSLLAMAGWTPGDVIRRSHILRMLERQQELNFQPGDDYDYSNSGYTLLAEVVARVSGVPFSQFCKQRILEPLGMKHSSFADGAELRMNIAYSYLEDSAGFFPRNGNDFYSGSGGLWTTCDDLSRWAKNFRDPKVGSPEVIKQMNEIGVLNNGKETGYAMGQMVEEYRGLRHIQHGGASSGYVAHLGHFPDQDFSIALTANCNSIAVRELSLRVADVFLRDDFEDDVAEKPEVASSRITLDESQLSRFSGRYWNGKNRSILISAEEDSLRYAIDGGPQITLAPISEFEFEMLNVGVKTKGIFEDDGDQYSLRIIQDRGEIHRYKRYEPATLDEDQRQHYVGQYHSEELGTVFSIDLEDDQLMVNHVRFSDIRLTPVIEDAFRCSGWRFTSIKFSRNAEGEVNGFRVNSMRNQNVRFTKVNLGLSKAPAAKTFFVSHTNAKEISAAPAPQEKTADSPHAELSTKVDAAVKAVMQQSDIPGATVVIVKEGKTIHKQGYGFANLEDQSRVDPDKTVFRIGSISKALSLLTLARQVDQGRVKMDDDVEKYFDGIRNPYSLTQPVTIKNLLTHTSGFDQIGGRDRQIRDFALALHQRKAARPELASYLKANRLRRVSPAGLYYRYDTYGSSLAGAILEQATGQPYAAAMKREMFQPLGMTSTSVEADSEHEKDLAIGYEKENGKNVAQPYEVYVTTPASSIDSTAADMGRLLEALTKDGANEHGRFVSPKMAKAIHGPQFRPHPEFCGTTHGLHESHIENSDGTKAARTLDHGGTMLGFSSLMAIFPEHKIGVFIVSNQSGGGRNPLAAAVTKTIVDHLPNVPSVKVEEIPPRDTTVDLSEYAGKYYYGVFCHTATRSDMEAGGVWGRGPARHVMATKGALIIGEEEYLLRGEDVFVRTDGKQKVCFGRNDDKEVSFFAYASSPDTFERENKEQPFPEFTSLADVVTQSLNADGVIAGVNLFAKHKDSSDHYLREYEMNNGGYGLLQLGKVDEAIAIFNLNVEHFPESWNAHDSLGEAYAVAGKTKLAIASYSRSIELNPENAAGKAQLEKLKKAQ